MSVVKDRKNTVTKIFLENLLSKRDLSPFYERVTNTHSKKIIYERAVTDTTGIGDKTYIIRDVPNYLVTELPHILPGLKRNKIITYQGFTIDLKQYLNIEDYLKTHFGKASRSKLRRYQNRLETCFDITYKVYYGAIENAEYDFLFMCLKMMLERRFDQKKEANYELQYWEDFHKITLPLIQEKRAFLFVIYDGDKPIDITLNMIYDKIVFSNISSYDIDYAPFSIGSIDMIKHVEWCFDNDFEVIDLLKGYMYYKQRWVNGSYDYERHIIYNSKSPIVALYANLITLRVALFYHIFRRLKKWNVDVLFHKYKNYLFQWKKKVNTNTDEQLTISNDATVGALQQPMDAIDFRKEEYAFLRKSIYQFAYSNSAHISTIEVFTNKSTPGKFLVRSKTKQAEITTEVIPEPV